MYFQQWLVLSVTVFMLEKCVVCQQPTSTFSSAVKTWEEQSCIFPDMSLYKSAASLTTPKLEPCRLLETNNDTNSPDYKFKTELCHSFYDMSTSLCRGNKLKSFVRNCLNWDILQKTTPFVEKSVCFYMLNHTRFTQYFRFVQSPELCSSNCEGASSMKDICELYAIIVYQFDQKKVCDPPGKEVQSDDTKKERLQEGSKNTPQPTTTSAYSPSDDSTTVQVKDQESVNKTERKFATSRFLGNMETEKVSGVPKSNGLLKGDGFSKNEEVPKDDSFLKIEGVPKNYSFLKNDAVSRGNGSLKSGVPKNEVSKSDEVLNGNGFPKINGVLKSNGLPKGGEFATIKNEIPSLPETAEPVKDKASPPVMLPTSTVTSASSTGAAVTEKTLGKEGVAGKVSNQNSKPTVVLDSDMEEDNGSLESDYDQLNGKAEDQNKPGNTDDKDITKIPADSKDTSKGKLPDIGKQDTVKKIVESSIEDAYDDSETSPGSGHFLAYFLTAVVICISGYIIYHNKQKILAFIIEGRNTGRGGRQRSKDVKYSQLKSSAEEVIPSLEQTATGKNFVY